MKAPKLFAQVFQFVGVLPNVIIGLVFLAVLALPEEFVSQAASTGLFLLKIEGLVYILTLLLVFYEQALTSTRKVENSFIEFVGTFVSAFLIIGFIGFVSFDHFGIYHFLALLILSLNKALPLADVEREDPLSGELVFLLFSAGIYVIGLLICLNAGTPDTRSMVAITGIYFLLLAALEKFHPPISKHERQEVENPQEPT